MPSVARSAPVPAAPRHVRCRPPAAITVRSARVTDVTRLPPREWRVHRDRHPPALARHARCTLAARYRSPPRAATVAPRSRPRTWGSSSPRITGTPPPFTSFASRPATMKQVRRPFLLRVLRMLHLEPLCCHRVRVSATSRDDPLEVHLRDCVNQPGIVGSLDGLHLAASHNFLELVFSPTQRQRSKVTSVQPQHIERHITRRLSVIISEEKSGRPSLMTTISPSRITSRAGSSRAIAFASASKRLIGFFVFDKNRPRSSSTYNVPRNPSSFNLYSQSRPRGTSRTSFGRMGSVCGSTRLHPDHF